MCCTHLPTSGSTHTAGDQQLWHRWCALPLLYAAMMCAGSVACCAVVCRSGPAYLIRADEPAASPALLLQLCQLVMPQLPRLHCVCIGRLLRYLRLRLLLLRAVGLAVAVAAWQLR